MPLRLSAWVRQRDAGTCPWQNLGLKCASPGRATCRACLLGALARSPSFPRLVIFPALRAPACFPFFLWHYRCREIKSILKLSRIQLKSLIRLVTRIPLSRVFSVRADEPSSQHNAGLGSACIIRWAYRALSPPAARSFVREMGGGGGCPCVCVFLPSQASGQIFTSGRIRWK